LRTSIRRTSANVGNLPYEQLTDDIAADATLGKLSDDPREQFRTLLRVASVLVRGIECDTSEFDKTLGVAVVLLHGQILVRAIEFVWKRHRMATASRADNWHEDRQGSDQLT
jgi:hypothetical protein